MNDDDEPRNYIIHWRDFNEYSTDDSPEDPIAPVSIEHVVDEIIVDGQLSERYNLIIYHFEKDSKYLWARAYLDSIEEVSVYGPFTGRDSLEIADAPIFYDEVLAYFKRRYLVIDRLGKEGYETVWKHPNYTQPE